MNENIIEHKVDKGYELSPQQRRLWLNRRGFMRVACRFALHQKPDEVRLISAFKQVAMQWTALKTDFLINEYSHFPLQYILSEPTILITNKGNGPLPGDESGMGIELALDASGSVIEVSVPSMNADYSALFLFIKDALNQYEKGALPAPEGLPYIKYAAWRNQLIKEGDEDAATFWRNYDYVTGLRPTHPFFVQEGDANRAQMRQMDIHLLNASNLLSMASSGQRSVASLLFSCWQVLLRGYLGDQVLTIGYCNHVRNDEELVGIMGNCVTLLPIIAGETNAQPFSELWEACDKKIEAVGEWIDFMDFTLSPTGIDERGNFNYGFDYFKSQELTQVAPGSLHFSGNIEYFSIKLCVNETSDGNLRLHLTYDALCIPEESVFIIKSHFERLIERLGSDPGLLCSALLNFQTDIDLQICEQAHTTSQPWPFSTISEAFRYRVEERPDHVAVQDGLSRLTFSELEQYSLALAHRLVSNYSVRPTDRVAIQGSRSNSFVVAMLAILKAGATFVPLDMTTPPERLNFILKDCGCKLLIRYNGDLTGEVVIPVLNIGFLSAPQAQPLDILKPTPDGTPAYIIYTSGTTGVPKGVLIGHGSILNYVKEVSARTGANETDKYAVLTSLAFDLAYTSLFCALLNGGTLCLIDESLVKRPSELANCLVNERITLIKITPSLLEALSISRHFKECLADSSVRLIIQGGEDMNFSVNTEILNLKRDIRIVNEYGPTETTIGVSTYSISSKPDFSFHKQQNIGKPFPNVIFKVLNSALEPLPIGIDGQLLIGGNCLALGYEGQLEMTQNRFVRLKGDERSLFYATGDKARWLPTGDVEFLGRSDDQLKVMGYRIEPGEVTARLRTHPAVKASETIIYTKPDGTRMLVAFVVSAGADKTKWKEWLMDFLPHYMIPSTIHKVERIPLNPNGKVDRKALMELHHNLQKGIMYNATRTASEKSVAEVWQKALGLKRIGLEDNFFALGGDSIKALRAVIMLKEFFADVEIKDIYEYKSLELLAAFLETKSAGNDNGGSVAAEITQDRNLLSLLLKMRLPGMESSRIDNVYPLSEMQMGMIYYYELHRNSGVFHDQNFYQVSAGVFDEARMKKALSLMMRQHEALRASYHLSLMEVPVQVIHAFDERRSHYEFFDLTNLDSEGQLSFINNFAVRDRENFLDLKNIGAWRLVIFKLDYKEFGVFWITHHVMTDGWSNASFVAELFATYKQLEMNEAYAPKPLKASLAEYFKEQAFYKTNASVTDFWKKELEGFERNCLPWQTDPAKSVKELDTEIHFVKIKPALIREIEKLSADLGISLQDIFLSAFTCVLKVVCNKPSINFGLVTNTRPQVEDADKLLGCFVNGILFNYNYKPGISLRDVILQISEHRQKLRSYERLPFAEIKKFAKEDRSVLNPLFDIQYNFVDFHVLRLDSHDSLKHASYLEVEGYSRNNTLFDFEVQQGSAGVTARIQYPARFYPSELVKEFGNYFIRVLESFTMDLDDGFSNKVVHGLSWRSIPESEEDTESIVDIFERIVLEYGNKTAISCYGRDITYERLNSASNALAHYLVKRGVVREAKVVVSMPRSIELVISILGIMKAGGCHVPVDTNTPRKRFDYILHDSQPAFIITDRAGKDFFEGCEPPLVLIEEILEASNDTNSGNLAIKVRPDQLAYLIYTSGTTGNPKGVLVDHYNVTRMFSISRPKIGFNHTDVWVLFHSYAFDFSLWETFGALLYGGRLVIYDYKRAGSLDEFADLLVQEKVTCLNQTPSAFYPLIPLLIERRMNLSLRYVIFSGEALSNQHLAELFKHEGTDKVRLLNMYGITETTMQTHFYEVTEKDMSMPYSKIGKILGDMEAYILDGNLDLLPVGVVGELYIGGKGVARGYWQRPELTKERFITHPVLGQKLYKTGDLASIDQEGDMLYHGRIDHQVKIRGYRIELGDVESALLDLPYIRQVVVISNLGADNVMRLVAFLVLHTKTETSVIKGDLAQKIPEYMIPSVFVMLDAFKLNSNGKIDRGALIVPEIEKENHIAEVQFASETEAKIATIWSSVLKIENIGPLDNFFELGGHSLQALLIVSRIRKEFNVALTVNVIFESQNLKGLAAEVERAQPSFERNIMPVPVQPHYGLSHAQTRMYVLSKMKDTNWRYNIAHAFHIKGRLSIDKLKQAFKATISRHESLRTYFVEVHYEPRQVIEDSEKSELYFKELTEFKEIGQACFDFEGIAKIEMKLTEPPLLRIYLYQLGTEEYMLGTLIHHIISDGWSMQILMSEVMENYDSLANSRYLTKPALAIQYKDYAAWDNGGEESARRLSSAEAFWKQHLMDLRTVVKIPDDKVESMPARVSNIIKHFQPEERLAIADFAQKQSVTTYSIAASAVYILLYRLTGKTDLSLGTVYSGRDHYLLMEQIGFFVNTLVLRHQLREDVPLGRMVKNVHRLNLKVLEHSAYPYDFLVNDWRQGGKSGDPFSVLIVYQNVSKMWTILSGLENLSVSQLELHLGASKFDITLLFNEGEENLSVSAQYDSSKYYASSVERYVDYIQEIMKAIVEQPDSEVSDLVLGGITPNKVEPTALKSDFEFDL